MSMADDKKYKTGSAGGPPNKIVDVEAVTGESGGKPPPNVIKGVEYIVTPETKAPPPPNVIKGVEYILTPDSNRRPLVS